MLTRIIKRDGREVDFDRSKIAEAIFKAAQVLGGNDYEMAQDLARKAEEYVERTCPGQRAHCGGRSRDAVEHTLIRRTATPALPRSTSCTVPSAPASGR